MSNQSQPPPFAIVMRGYDVEQVNQVMARINAARANPAEMSTVATELRTASFAVVMRGFDRAQVDGYIAEAAAILAGSGQAAAQLIAEQSPPQPEPRSQPQPTGGVPSLSSRPRGERFPKRFGNAYRPGDVDAFVERVNSTLNTTLTSHETRSVRFGTGLRGYAVEPVDGWIDQVRAYLESRGR